MKTMRVFFLLRSKATLKMRYKKFCTKKEHRSLYLEKISFKADTKNSDVCFFLKQNFAQIELQEFFTIQLIEKFLFYYSV